MIPLETVAMLLVAVLASLFTAWTIGAGSSGATPFAPAVGANAISTMRAAFVVGLLGFTGAVLQGAAVSETIGHGLVGDVTLSPLAATIALLTAAGLIALGVFAGYPIATAFAATGAVVGVGLALGGTPAWAEYRQIGLLWLLTPFVGSSLAYASARLLRSDRIPDTPLMALFGGVVGLIVATMEFGMLGTPTDPASLASVVAARLPGPQSVGLVATTLAVGVLAGAVVGRASAHHAARAQRRFLLALGGLVAFSAGAGKVGLAIGPLLPLVGGLPVTVPVSVVLLLGGVGLLTGSWMAATRMIKALSQDYSELGPRRSIAVLIPSFAIAQAAIFYGLPMSFNEIFISAIVGSGYAAGRSGVSQRKILYTLLAWFGSLLLSLAISYGAGVLLT